MPGRMLRTGLAAALVLGAACSSDDPASSTSNSSSAQASPTATGCEGGCWQQVRPLGSGGFPPAPGSRNEPVWKPGLFPLTLTPHLAFDGHLWMTAQTVAYSSPDGLAWAEHAKTDWGGRIYHAVAYFRDRLWMFGGLDYQSRSFRNDIWSSADGRTWERAGTAPWAARGQHAVVVHQGRLWLLGGADRVDADRSADRFLNDVWVSEDGLRWTEVTDHAPWTARGYPGALVLGDDLFVVGGRGAADVWRSRDGRQWTQVAADAPWGARHDFGRVAYGGRLWVFGGWAGRSTEALNDVWSSVDGATWDRQAQHAPWAPRSPISVAFDGKVWVYSGKHTGAEDNWGGDLWQMTAGP